MSAQKPTEEEILALVSLPEVMSKHVLLSVEREGRRGSCPWHPDASRGLYVDRNGRFYHCFSCGRHGDALRWVMEREGVDRAAAMRLLADRLTADGHTVRH